MYMQCCEMAVINKAPTRGVVQVSKYRAFESSVDNNQAHVTHVIIEKILYKATEGCPKQQKSHGSPW
jgi:hypothetical protein